ncbi:hypothetical protein CpB0170 [Chlamydia pneumoniae TW-183]|uniref:Uncharacterized protein n=3 Tax=Chlamydia pneumoniae TaxID=83558 RepID=Q9Z915_CHLPN|nr:hypothetical protein [Chlamydia pneumoniae]AAD18322.1 hypothetical protein CPn_0169 [Chlamydia pneumoniae CWL029]AAF38418.1 hypothetical protein CP_0602 [Chlamydia pneumoniae AR39]AAP98103.1 hypothetical protein CpB0170 [Chlamydia pneumoniae TW-183]CRI32667.1 Uncharacterized protein BN1224_Wien1_A_01740 [Chlamydia pneumoniae]CRI35528.1 Uncharacterized protein BN1224_CM1_A_01750 [Chlamydia pneumoniae]
MKNVGSECSQPLVMELNTQPLRNLCESRLVKITSFVIALLALVGGITLTALAGAGILSFLPWLVLGIVLVVLCALFLLFSYKFCPIKELGVVYNTDSQIHQWFQKQRNKDLEKATENPELFGENRAEDNNRSARSQVKETLRDCDGNVLKKIYERNLDVLLFMNWVPKTMDDVDPVSEDSIRTVISCYKLIKACKPEFRSLISELLRAMQSGLGLLSRCSRYQERAKTVSHKDAPLFCPTHSYYRDGYLTPLRAGPRYIINRAI